MNKSGWPKLLFKTEGIVIKNTDYGESHKIVTLYTKEYGKLSLMARGAKKPKSRLSATSQLFTYGLFLFFRKSPRSMGTLSQGERLQSFHTLRQDLFKTAYAAYFAELVDKLTEDDEREPFLFQLLLTAFSHLEEGKDPELLARLFELKMLVLSGYKPEVDRCVVCRKIEGPFLFSIREGGFLCQECSPHDAQALALGANTLKLLRFLYHLNPARMGKVEIRPTTREELRQALWLFMDEHTPLKLKSRSFLEHMGEFWND
jgi:DNA repair protein RecO (recombination protein O)